MKSIKYSVLLLVAVFISLSNGYNQQERITLPVRDYNVQSQDVVRQKSTNLSGYLNGRFVIKPDEDGLLDFDTTLANNLQQAINKTHESNNLPGISAAMLIPGKGIWFGVSGYSTLEPIDSVSIDMLFNIASSTKSFISAIILKLAEEGELSLDDSIGTYLKDLPSTISNQITIRQLLNMTSGVYNFFEWPGFWPDMIVADLERYWTFEDLITEVVGSPRQQPGISYYYCNTNLILAGMIIRDVTQKSISNQLHQRIFEPLALEHTYYPAEDTLVGPIAHPWDNGVDNWNITNSVASFSMLSTPGGIYSTAEDLARWGYALFSGKILTPESLEHLQTMVPATDCDGYGLCVYKWPILGKRLWGHDGWYPAGYSSYFYFYPRTGISFAMLYTGDNTINILKKNASILFNEYLKTFPVSSTAKPGVLYTLSYSGGDYGVYLAEIPSLLMHTVGQAMYTGLTKFRAHPVTGDLWGIASPSDVGKHLVKFDGVTGEAFPRVKITLPGSYTLKGMDFFSDGTLYVASIEGDIFSVDTASGVGTLVVSSHIPISALTLHPVTGELWASVKHNFDNRIYRINIQNGDTVGVGNTGFDQYLNDIAFDSEGKLFGAIAKKGIEQTRLVYIDTETGKGTKVESYDGNIYSIAFTSGAVMSSLPKSDIGESGWFKLDQNYPNPFSSSTVISYQLPSIADVELSVYDLLGQKVTTLVKERQQPGSYEVTWDATDFPDGIYFYRLEAGDFVESRKLILQK